MKVTIYSWEEGWDLCQALYIDDKWETTVRNLCECPEDAVIGRDLISCNDIARYMERAVEAVKNGEPFDIEQIEGNPNE